jgi:L-threonine kinase
MGGDQDSRTSGHGVECSTLAEGMARVALPATCGELVQGTLDGVPCLVSCPIGRYGVAEVCLRSEPGWKVPPDAPKSVAALRASLAHLGRPEQGGQLRLTSDLPRSRGYGSSTADVGATMYALSQALSQPLTAAEVAWLAVRVEPSDSTLFPGLALFDHRDGSFYQELGPAPPLTVMVLDPGGEVDTLAFNRLDHREALGRLAPQHLEAFTLLREGLKCGDWQTLGEAATLSARAHQAILPNPLLEPALVLARGMGALGICLAHSGTLLGLLLDPARADVAAAAAFVTRHLPDEVAVACYPLVDGGPQVQGAL